MCPDFHFISFHIQLINSCLALAAAAAAAGAAAAVPSSPSSSKADIFFIIPFRASAKDLPLAKWNSIVSSRKISRGSCSKGFRRHRRCLCRRHRHRCHHRCRHRRRRSRRR